VKNILILITITVALPLFGFLFLGIWWRYAFTWDLETEPSLILTGLYFIAWSLICAFPLPILIAVVLRFKKKQRPRGKIGSGNIS